MGWFFLAHQLTQLAAGIILACIGLGVPLTLWGAMAWHYRLQDRRDNHGINVIRLIAENRRLDKIRNEREGQ